VTNFARVDKFNSSGVFDRAWGRNVISSGPGNNGTGYEICVAANGDNCKFGEANADGLNGTMEDPFALAADGNGSIYVINDTHHEVTKYSNAGVFERAWGKDVASAGPGNTGTGFEICVVANGDTCQAGSSGALAGEFNTAQGIASDSAGTVYVSDKLNNRIEKFAAAPSAPSGPGIHDCGGSVGSGAGNFHPKVHKKDTVLGVRAVLDVSQPSDLSISARATIHGKSINLGQHALSNVAKQAKLRIPLPKRIAKKSKKGDKATLFLDITTTPKSAVNCGAVFRQLTLHTKVINVRANLLG
jgi:hypothetical protein